MRNPRDNSILTIGPMLFPNGRARNRKRMLQASMT